jgi:hypothetical protein
MSSTIRAFLSQGHAVEAIIGDPDTHHFFLTSASAQRILKTGATINVTIYGLQGPQIFC